MRDGRGREREGERGEIGNIGNSYDMKRLTCERRAYGDMEIVREYRETRGERVKREVK